MLETLPLNVQKYFSNASRISSLGDYASERFDGRDKGLFKFEVFIYNPNVCFSRFQVFNSIFDFSRISNFGDDGSERRPSSLFGMGRDCDLLTRIGQTTASGKRAEWMRFGDTEGRGFIRYSMLLQFQLLSLIRREGWKRLVSAVCAVRALSSAFERRAPASSGARAMHLQKTFFISWASLRQSSGVPSFCSPARILSTDQEDTSR